MCGIVGYVTGKNTTNHEKFFKQALIADILRGFDSTGVIIGDDKGWGTYKKAVNAIDFLDMKKASNLVNSNGLNRPAFMIGHNRAATVGNVNAANAHPFEHGDLVGVHNGTLRTYHRLENNRGFDTDSEALYYNLSKRDDIADVLGDVKGAYALVWYNSAEDTVNIIRNDERPLCIAKIKDEDTILWASERGMLQWIAGRCGLKIESTFEPKPNLHIKFHMQADTVSNFEYEQLEVKDNYPSYKPPAKQHNLPAGNQAGGAGQGSGQASENVLKQINLDKSQKYNVQVAKFQAYATGGEYGQAICYMLEDPFLEVRIRSVSKELFDSHYANTEFPVTISDVLCPTGNYWEAYAVGNRYNPSIQKTEDQEEVYNGPDGKFISRTQMANLTAQGCCMCHGGISIAEFDFTDWIDGKPVCPTCVERSNDYMEA
ncbi:MAG: class II glutamine amidotransferase [Gammaproteobacteria bacterium]|nr:class II glutamine amidotransferase [Gammaproteobacteria bacterium]MCW8982471.1 class II glutamine amidotransferase [Gammaproteobacteria bacterium]